MIIDVCRLRNEWTSGQSEDLFWTGNVCGLFSSRRRSVRNENWWFCTLELIGGFWSAQGCYWSWEKVDEWRRLGCAAFRVSRTRRRDGAALTRQVTFPNRPKEDDVRCESLAGHLAVRPNKRCGSALAPGAAREPHLRENNHLESAPRLPRAVFPAMTDPYPDMRRNR